MKLSTFNLRKVKPGQWFSRLWKDGEALAEVLRFRLEKVLVTETGRHLCLVGEDGRKLQTCGHITKTDFLRICGANGQPLGGAVLADLIPAPENKVRKHWYHEQD